MRTFLPGKWASLPILVVNGRSESRELLCSTYFGEDSSLQYGRTVWVPPQSLLRIEHPVLIPKIDRERGRNLDLHSLIFDGLSSKEALVRADDGKLRHDAALLVSHDSRNTAIIGKPPVNKDAPPDEFGELIAASRVELQKSRSFGLLGEAFLPAEELCLDSLDYIVVIDDRILSDYAATAALRRWLYSGGHLWIALDRVSPQLLERLLGDDFAGYVVDQVGLTSIRVDEAPDPSDPDGTIGETVEHDDPVVLVRTSITGVNVTHLVNGWPAAMTIPCGDGKLLITTLGARGWMRARPENEPRPSDPLMVTNFRPTPPMINVADEFFRLRHSEVLPSAAVETQVREYIGYNVLSWRLIVGTLLGFSACFIAIGVWLIRYDRLEWICWAGSIPALAVSLFLLQAGRANRQSIPAMAASVQLVQAIRGVDDVRSAGVAAVYRAEGSDFPLAATDGGYFTPDLTGLEKASRRLVTTDLGAYYWENLSQPAGVRVTPFTHSESLTDRLVADVTFDAHGIVGRYRGGMPPGTDAILATRDGRLGVTLRSDGTFSGRSDDVFEDDQYLSAGLLNDEQDRRRRTLKALLSNPQRPDYPAQPQLMFWSGPRDNGFRFGDELHAEGASLVAVPLTFERPPDGTEILIPSPLLSYVNRQSPDGTKPSAMWNDLKKQWQERSSPGLAWLSIQIPRSLMPVTLLRAKVDLKVTGPIGRVEIFGLRRNEVVSLGSVMNPVGSLSFDISDGNALAVDSEGRLALAVSAGQSGLSEPSGSPPGQTQPAPAQPVVPVASTGAKANYWRIESLTIQLSGRTAELISEE